MDALNRQLKKGVLDVIVLRLLKDGKMYGYEIMTQLGKVASGYFAVKEGTLYPILYRLEDAGYIQNEWEKDSAKRGVPRKYYLLMPAGKEYLKQAKHMLETFNEEIKQIMEEE